MICDTFRDCTTPGHLKPFALVAPAGEFQHGVGECMDPMPFLDLISFQVLQLLRWHSTSPLKFCELPYPFKSPNLLLFVTINTQTESKARFQTVNTEEKHQRTIHSSGLTIAIVESQEKGGEGGKPRMRSG